MTSLTTTAYYWYTATLYFNDVAYVGRTLSAADHVFFREHYFF
jgi:hypothetical protein